MKIQNFREAFFIIPIMIAGMVKAECVVDGMNLWQLAECIACSIGAQYEIKQANFTDTIVVPGHYKVCENLSGGTFLSIVADNVILDLGGYVLDGIEIAVDDGFNNIVIRNGTLKNTFLSGISLGAGSRNTVVENIIIDTMNSDLGAGISCRGGADGLLIRNVTIYNGAPKNILLRAAFDDNNNIILENITCIGTNPSLTTVPTNPSAVIYVQGCDNLVLNNITLTDQFQELNGVWLDTCSNVEVDGVHITSSLAAPMVGAPDAYQVTDSVVGIHKNIVVNGGDNQVFNRGIGSTGTSSENIFDTCYVENVRAVGITLDTGDAALNSVVNSCRLSGFVVAPSGYVDMCSASNTAAGEGFLVSGTSSVIKNSSAFNNATFGFNITTGTNSQFDACSADGNGTGFFIEANGCSLNACSANNNRSDGFSMNVTDGCFISNSIANDNLRYGFHVDNIFAESLFVLGVPTNNSTWNIGQSPVTPPANPAHVDNRNVRLVDNIALRNRAIATFPTGFVMEGTVFDRAFPLNPVGVSFITQIFPPIGVLNTIQGIIYVDPKPQPNTAIGGDTGIAGNYANTKGGNLVNDK